MPNKERKKESFKRLAESRTNEILKKIGLLGNLSNKNNYSFTTKDVEKIFKEIEKELVKQKKKFNGVEDNTFKL